MGAGGTTLPDLGLLAPLARLLGTDANGLLAFQQEMDRQALADFAARLVQTAAADGVPAALALARTQRQQFPRSGALALTLALNLEGLLAMQAQEPAAADQAWLEELYHQAADSQDEAVAAQARAMLFGKAMASQEYDQAQQLLDRLPDRPLYHKEQMAAQLALARQDNAQAGRLMESQLLEQVSAVQTTLLTLMELAAREGRQADLAHLAQRAQAVGEDFQLSAYTVWAVRMEQACLTKDRAQGLAALEGLLVALGRNAGPRSPRPSDGTWPGRAWTCTPCGEASCGSWPTRKTRPMTFSGTIPGSRLWWERERSRRPTATMPWRGHLQGIVYCVGNDL